MAAGTHSRAIADLISTSTPPGGQRRIEPFPTGFDDDAVRYGKNQPVETIKPVEPDKIDAVIALRFLRVGERVANQRLDAEIAQFHDDARDAAVAQDREHLP